MSEFNEVSEFKYEFNPLWLHSLQRDRRMEVVAWLEGHGIDVQTCQSFTLRGGKVICAMYALRDGKPFLNGNDVVLDADITFTPKKMPYAVEHTPPMHY